MRDDRERLKDIQEAILRIEKHTAQGRSAFEREELNFLAGKHRAVKHSPVEVLVS